MDTKTVIGAALLLFCSPVFAQPFFLSCELEFQYDGKKMSVDYKIDEEKKTVNDLPATFTETAISYNKTAESSDFLTVISRLTGRIRVTSGNELFAQGTCTVSNTRKF